MRYLKKTRLILVPMLILILSSALFATEPPKAAKKTASTYNDFSVFSDDKYDQIEANMLAGIKSDNTGLQTSCAYFLGEMKSDMALIPLLKLVRNSSSEEARIIAALSLYKIKSKIGMYRLRGLSKTDKSELAKRVFDTIYKKYVSDNYSFREW